jgi:hypothetical protein
MRAIEPIAIDATPIHASHASPASRDLTTGDD